MSLYFRPTGAHNPVAIDCTLLLKGHYNCCVIWFAFGEGIFFFSSSMNVILLFTIVFPGCALYFDSPFFFIVPNEIYCYTKLLTENTQKMDIQKNTFSTHVFSSPLLGSIDLTITSMWCVPDGECNKIRSTTKRRNRDLYGRLLRTFDF
jgi:hypothetical protein